MNLLSPAKCYLEILQAVVEKVHQDPGQVLDWLDGVVEHAGGHRGREAVGHVLEQLGDGPGLVRVKVWPGVKDIVQWLVLIAGHIWS